MKQSNNIKILKLVAIEVLLKAAFETRLSQLDLLLHKAFTESSK